MLCGTQFVLQRLKAEEYFQRRHAEANVYRSEALCGRTRLVFTPSVCEVASCWRARIEGSFERRQESAAAGIKD